MNYVEAFKTHLEDTDKATNTIVSYIDTINKFQKWLASEKRITDISIIGTREIKEFRERLLEQSPVTANQRLSSVKTFFHFLKEANLITLNPALHIKLQKLDTEQKSQYLSRQEELAVLRSAQQMGKRANAILLTFIRCGIRLNELSNLRINHLNLDDEATLLVKNSKRNRSRYVPIPLDALNALKEWLTERNQSDKLCHQRSDYVFTSQREGRLQKRGVQQIIKEIGKKAGVAHLYAIRFRCTYINTLIQDCGMPLNLVAELCGHSIAMTVRYGKSTLADKRRFTNRLSEI